MMEAMLSKTFYGSGIINGGDQKPILQPPWENVSIWIVGTEMVLYEGYGKIAYVSCCNDYSKDVMGWMGGTETRASSFYPAGCGVPFPAFNPSGPNPKVDLHLGGQGVGFPFQVFFTLYYFKGPIP